MWPPVLRWGRSRFETFSPRCDEAEMGDWLHHPVALMRLAQVSGVAIRILSAGRIWGCPW